MQQVTGTETKSTEASTQTQTVCICGPGEHRPGCFMLFPKKSKRFSAKDADGATYSWYFRYSPSLRVWVLGDYTGYERILEITWRDSVPRIRAILANHGMAAEIS